MYIKLFNRLAYQNHPRLQISFEALKNDENTMICSQRKIIDLPMPNSLVVQCKVQCREYSLIGQWHVHWLVNDGRGGR